MQNNNQFGGFPPQQNGFAPQQNQGFQQPQQFAQPNQAGAPQGGGNADAVFGFETNYEALAAESENRIDLEPGIYVWAVESVTLFNTTTNNKGIRLNFATGQTKSDGTQLTIDNTFYLLDKQTDCKTFNTKQVDKMRKSIFKTFGLTLPQYMQGITSLYDIHVVDNTVGILDQLLKGKQAAVELNWPDEVNNNGDAYLEIRWMNPTSDYDYLCKKFTAKPKPTAVGGQSLPGANGFVGGMPSAPQVNLPTQNPTAGMAYGAAPIGSAPVQQAQQPQQQFAQPQQQFAQPQQQFAQPQQSQPQQFGQPQPQQTVAQGNPYAAPAQPQAPVQQAQPEALNPSKFLAGSGALPGTNPQHKSLHPAWENAQTNLPPLYWNAENQTYMFMDGNGNFVDMPF
jgi:hypothetical protein